MEVVILILLLRYHPNLVPVHSEKTNNGSKNNKKNIFNKNERCRDVKTQKACKQGCKVGRFNIGPKIKQTTSIYITLHKYCYKAKYKQLYLCRVIWKWFV